jgi:hypothetical protein
MTHISNLGYFQHWMRYYNLWYIIMTHASSPILANAQCVILPIWGILPNLAAEAEEDTHGIVYSYKANNQSWISH